jgi:hypothetical protein
MDYNPLNWFRKPQQSELTLYCDNPQCSDPIEKGPVAYDKNQKEVYHPGQCGMFANAHKVINSGSMSIGCTTQISLDQALKLLRKGGLSQVNNIETKL